MSKISTNFKAYMQNASIICDQEIIIDGKIHRFHIIGDRAGSKNGWYVLYELDNGLYKSENNVHQVH